jgi:hypothetical protein
MQRVGSWKITILQRPPGAHLSLTDANQVNWKEFVTTLKKCVEAMKNDPSLNQNTDTALYGMSKMIPDKALLRDFCCLH